MRTGCHAKVPIGGITTPVWLKWMTSYSILFMGNIETGDEKNAKLLLVASCGDVYPSAVSWQ